MTDTTSARPHAARTTKQQPAPTTAFGIDIGGSGMKAAPVDLATGTLAKERLKIATPQPSTPDAMADVVTKLLDHFEWRGPAGVTFPGVVHHGIAKSAANVDKSWVNTDIDAVFTEASGRDVKVINDADAAGLAEMRYGAGQGRDGVVMLFTFGTGVGSALFLDGKLVPNTELGHMELDGKEAEKRAAASARDRENLSWKAWAERVDRYLERIVFLFSPDLIIVGGGVSRRPEKWLPEIDVGVEIVPAALSNDAGIVGAALIA
jgi:polyphosphate glucokinase